jgi:hypothetical protein
MFPEFLGNVHSDFYSFYLQLYENYDLIKKKLNTGGLLLHASHSDASVFCASTQ